MLLPNELFAFFDRRNKVTMILFTEDHHLLKTRKIGIAPFISKLIVAHLIIFISIVTWIVPHSGIYLVSYASDNIRAPFAASTSQVGLETTFVLASNLGNSLQPAQESILSRGSPSLPEIALTFDDGPNPYYTLQILAILKQFGIKATFFCIGRQVALFPKIVKQEYSNGNVIGDHTWSHPFLPSLSPVQIYSQMAMTSDILQKTIGVRPKFFRPPYGSLDSTVLVEANELKLTTTLWSDDPRDWSLPGTAAIISRVLSVAGNGTIILMHDGGGNRAETVAALPTIIETLLKRGFHFVTLPQLLSDLEKNSGPYVKE
jgi:peptidoglycan/xylan/chitin deacetylase (PgdA/CDA1 family)